MPLPNYGYNNREKKEHQELKFKMAPEVVDDPNDTYSIGGRKESRKKGKVTTGTIGIDLERKLIMHKEKDANVWKPPEIDRQEVEEIKKFASPAHQNLKREVRSTLDSLISGNKARQIHSQRENQPPPGLSHIKSSSPKSSFSSGRETTRTGISIQPKGAYKLDSKKSLGSFSLDNNGTSGSHSGSSSSVSRSSYSSYSMSSSSNSFKY